MLTVLRVFAGRQGQALSLLQYALGEVYGISRLPAIARMPGGKPWFPDAAHICFNLSHSGEMVLCAVGDGPVGVDIEQVRPRRERLPRYALSQAEYRRFTQMGGSWEDFYTLWTRKEAWCKYTGEGLPGHPSAVSAPEDICMRSYTDGIWRCAVCAGEPPPDLEWAEGYAGAAGSKQGF